MSRPLLLGHRGARAVRSIPENTIASFDRALAEGCDGFEFDIRLTADGEAVVCHDPRSGKIEIARTPARQLPSLPRLQDVLERYHDAFLDVELKVPGLERIVTEALKRYQPRRFVLSSFLPEVLQILHVEYPAAVLGLICETTTQLRRWNELPVEYVIPHHKLLTPELLSELKAAAKKVLVWTVNNPADLRRLAGAGVDGIISDDPGGLRRELEARGE